jgi:dipeptidyl aminopeptidase/acylaminoacyl peptidase
LGSGGEDFADAAASRRVHQIGPVIAWDSIDLPEPELVTTTVGDARLHARIYRAEESNRTEAMIVWVHGGPTDQWQVTFMPRVAWLWSLGLDVVVVDPRGSTGHGREYQQALRGRWGELDAADTADLIASYQRESGITPDRTLIAGSSSGGLTVLAVLRHYRELVAGGIAISPVSDLADLADRSHRYEAHYSLSLVGDPSDLDRYHELSPVHYADQISAPILIIHGEEDPVVPADHSRTLAARIAAAGGRVDLHLFPGEGHGLRQIPHRLEEYRLIRKFIEQILTGG